MGLGTRKWVFELWKDGWRDRPGIPCMGHRKRSDIVHKIIFSSRFALRMCAFVCSCKMNYMHYSKANFVLSVICSMGVELRQ
jgi:hypothetical protein